MVSPQEWGPHAWNLLHGIAERVGRHDKTMLIKDEQNAIRLTLRSFSALMPCLKCQSHYRSWCLKNPPELFLGQVGEDLRESLQGWLYDLHEEVNSRKEVISGIQRDALKEMYSNIHLRGEAAALRNVYQRGLQQGVLKSEDWKMAYKNLDFLLRYIGV